MTMSKLVLHVKADIIYRLKNDIMEDFFLFKELEDSKKGFQYSIALNIITQVISHFFIRIIVDASQS